MNISEDFQKKTKNVQEALTKNAEITIMLIEEFKKFFEIAIKDYKNKITIICDQRSTYLSKAKDENKMSLYKDSANNIDNLIKYNNQLVNNLNSSLIDLKSFLLKEPDIFNYNEDNDKKNKEKKLTINHTDYQKTGKAIIYSEDRRNLEYIEVKGFSMNDIGDLFNELKKQNESKEDDNQNKMEIKKFKIKKSKLLNINIPEYFPYIENLTICDSEIGYSICPNINFDNLTQLSLEGIDLVNENFQEIIIYLLKDRSKEKGTDYIGKNLKSLSVKNNRISQVLLPGDDKRGKIIDRNDFENLEYLNLSVNNIFNYYYTGEEKTLFKSVKLLDLTCNNITSPKIIRNLLENYKSEKEKESLILLAKNIGLIKNRKIRESYSDYFENKLKTFKLEKFKIKSFIFEGLFIIKNKNNQNVESTNIIEVKDNEINIEENNQNQQNEYLFRINLNKYKSSLVELNLSFNNIRDNDINLIFENNKELANLKRLNLSSNAISEQFFVIFTNNNYYEYYHNLKLLNLSGNPITFDEAKIYQKFILNCKNLESLILKNTPIGKDINNFLKYKVVSLEANKVLKKKIENDKKTDELENLIFKDQFSLKNLKVNVIISNNTKKKYITFLNINFPYILEIIKFEEQK